MQALRDFWRFHFLKALLGLVVIQLVIVAWLQVRNHRPEAIADEITVIEGQTVKIQPLRNDTDKDDTDLDSLQIFSVESSLKGELKHEGKYLVYNAEYGFVGVDSFNYVISDGSKESKAAYIKISIAKNLEPLVNNDYMQLYVGNSINLEVLGNDDDREGDSIFIQEFTQPNYGELNQNGNTFNYKPNVRTAQVDSFKYILSDGHNNSEQATVIIDIKDKTYACYPWLNTDVGNIEQQGSIECAGNKFVVKASGNDIWDNRDGFNYTYQEVVGDCEMIVKVDKLEDTHEWAKAGLFFKEDLSAGSKNVLVAMTSKNGATFQRRSQANTFTEGLGGKEGVKVPCWIKLQRKGINFTAFCSVDGSDWEEFGKCELEMNASIYAGIALTSHDNSKLCEAVFSQVKIRK